MLICEKFNVYFDKHNKWTIMFEDKKGRLIHMMAIPPYLGDRIDIVTNKDIEAGYQLGIDVFIIEIRSGNPKLKLIDHGKIVEL